MRWLLVTALHDNPGDEFVRVGIERLIRSVDRYPIFRLVHKESFALGESQPFDRAVWCGMPMFWAHGSNACWRIGWWDGLTGWIAADPRRFLIIGAGSFARWPGERGISDPIALHEAAADVLRSAWRVYARDPVVAEITGHQIECLPCPAVFAPPRLTPICPGASVCNLMPDGGHYPDFGPQQRDAWVARLPGVARVLRDAGFIFAAHTNGEHDFARSLGWRRDRIVTDSRDPSHLLSLYAGCVRYFGNRVHGGIAARGAGADVWSVGYDSRQEAVRLCGGRATAPADLDLGELTAWAAADPVAKPFDFDREFQRQRRIFAEFIE